MQHIFPENCYQHLSLPIFLRSLHHVLIGNIFYKLVASVGPKKIEVLVPGEDFHRGLFHFQFRDFSRDILYPVKFISTELGLALRPKKRKT